MNCKLAAILSALAGAFVLVSSAFAIPTVYPHGATIHEAGVAEGYMIFGGRDGNAHLVDVDGNEVHTWTIPCGASFVARPLGGGHILAESCGNLVELDWDGNVVSQVAPPSGASFHHNAERLPNGNTVVLCQQPLDEPTISDKQILEDFVIEVAPDGSTVWEWHEAEHFGDFGFSQERIDKIYELGGDWSHANGLAVIPDSTLLNDPRFIPGNVIITLRNQNTVAIIDPTTSQLVYIDTDFAIGPTASYMIPSDYPGGDNLLMLETSYTGEWNLVARDHSRVWETYPIYNYRPFLYIDQYSGLRRGSFFTYSDGAVQRLSNGDTLITEGAFGRVFEISAVQDLIWEYVSPYYDVGNSNAILSAYKVPLDWAGSFFAPDLVLSAVDGPEHDPAGKGRGARIRVVNAASEPAVNVRMVYRIPPDGSFRSISAPVGWDCSAPPVGGNGTITCAKPSLSPSSEDIFGLVVEAVGCDGPRAVVTNSATVSSDGSEVTPADNSTTIRTTARCR